MKKILLGLGAITAVTAPVVVAVSCNNDEDTRTEAQKIADGFRDVIAHPSVQTGTRTHLEPEIKWQEGKNILEETIIPGATGEQDTLYEWTFRLPESIGLMSSELSTKIENAVKTAEHIQHGFTIGNYDNNNDGTDDHIEMTIVASTANGQAEPNHDWSLDSTAHAKILNDVLEVIEKQ